MLAVALTVALATTPALADKDDEKAKEAAVAFLKAVKSKDADAVLKTAELPFLTMNDGAPKVWEKADELKADLKAKLDTINDAAQVPTVVEKVVPFAELKDRIREEDRRKAVEKVMGDGGYLAFVKTPDEKLVVILVRLKDGKAKVVGFGQQ